MKREGSAWCAMGKVVWGVFQSRGRARLHLTVRNKGLGARAVLRERECIILPPPLPSDSNSLIKLSLGSSVHRRKCLLWGVHLPASWC